MSPAANPEGHAWVAHEFGEPAEVLRWEQRAYAPPTAGSLLVEVLAAGVGLPDSFMLRGSYPLVRQPPVTPGQEVCGRIVEAPEGSAFAPGDRVFGTTQFYAGSGGFATHAYMGEGAAFVAPSSFTDAQAAGFYIGFRTAYTALVTRCALQPGETVLVLGGSGSSGAAAISLAKALDAKVVAVASTDEKRAFCRELGADVVVDRDADALKSAVADFTGGAGIDVGFDPVGGPIANAAMRLMARYGRFGLVGFASGEWATVDPADAVMRNYSVLGVLAAGFSAEEDTAHMGHLIDLAASGHIATPLAEARPMAEVPSVVSSLGGSVSPGKLVVLGPRSSEMS